MKSLGYLLIALGFLSGALAAVHDREAVPLKWYLGALVVGAVGIVLVRTARYRTSHHQEHLEANLDQLEQSLTRIVENAELFERDKASQDVFTLRHWVDAIFREDLEIFVESRESIAHSYGLQAYTEVMSHFAAGERHLNRVWSASTDGYIDEACASVALALGHFREARDTFRQWSQRVRAE